MAKPKVIYVHVTKSMTDALKEELDIAGREYLAARTELGVSSDRLSVTKTHLLACIDKLRETVTKEPDR